MKYKSQLPSQIKAFIEWQLEHYKETKRQIEQYKIDLIPSATPNYSAEPKGSGEENRSLEDLTIKIVSDRYIMQATRMVEAINHVLDRCSKEDIQIIDLVYWRGQYTPAGAGLVVGYARSTVYARINAILTAIAKELGYLSI